MSTMTDPSDPSGDYVAYMDGTSMACPHVAGVVALLESVNPSLSATDKMNIITDPANVKSYNQTKDVGVGIVDAYKCLQAAGGGCDLAADFSGSPTSGCASLAVSFTDLSTGSGIDGWSWDFGDGGSSTSQNPSHTYSNPGTYTVSLTVSSSSQGCNDTRTRNSYITVDGGPTAGFVGSPTSGTEPLTVDFTNQSSNATSYSWDFGDGGSSTATNPSHTYDAAGTYTVSLTATNACGSDVETKTDYITVNPCVAPVADFSGSPTSGDAPLTVDFTDLSSDATSWSWDFGDGGSSTAQNPSHTYDAAGTYTVSLTATNGCGSDGETKTDYITVTEPTVDYATLPYSTGFESGSFDQYWFTQSSNSEGRILVTTANSPRGSYHVTMDDNTNGSQYAQNEAWLRLNLSGGGDVDLTFYWKEFSDESHTQDGVFFSDDGGSTFTKVYDLTGGSSTYQQIVLDVDQLAGNAGLSLTSTFVVKFQQYDNYSITTDGHAIDDISVESTILPAPVADFAGSPTSGDAPLEVSFTDQSTNSPTSWSWDFGDGGSSTVQNPTYTYSSAGTYTVSLTATNASGSDTETKTDYITVTDPPVSQVVGEVGEIVRNQGGGGADWYSVTLNNTYSNPVVVMRGLSFNGGHPTHLRVRNVGTGSFEWQMEEWDYKDGNHTTENCPYMVVEAGVHTLEDGTIIQAGTVSASTSWVTVNFSSSFTSTPTLLTGVASDNDPAACITRTRNLGTGSFQIKVQEEEAADGVHSSETVAWIAIEQGTGTNNSVAFEAGRTGNEVTDAWYTINYTQSFGATPIFLCHDDTYDGGNTCGTRFRNNSTTSVEVFIEEEQSNDSETGHITEVVSWVAWGAAGDILSQSQVASIGKEDAVEMASTDNGLPSRYRLDQNYPNPFNPVTTIEFSLAQPGHAKLEVFNIAGQKVTTLVDQYLSSGEHVATWDGSNVSSGVYFYRLTTERRADTRKMILLK
jgi:PKD repeat protein